MATRQPVAPASRGADALQFVCSCDLTHEVFRFKIKSLYGIRDPGNDPILNDAAQAFQLAAKSFNDPVVEAYLFGGDEPLCMPVTTSYRTFTDDPVWDETIALPLTVADLTLDATLVLNVYELSGPGDIHYLGGAILRLFDDKSLLRMGKVTLRLEQQQSPIGPELTNGDSSREGTPLQALQRRLQDYWQGFLPQVPWLDELMGIQLDKMLTLAQAESPHTLFLDVSFAWFRKNIVFADRTSNFVKEPQFKALDPEIYEDSNLVEGMHHLQMGSSEQHVYERNDKPNPAARDRLAEMIMKSPTDELSGEEKGLLWRFRYYLSRNGTALSKVLKSINWQTKEDTENVAELLDTWARIDVATALELLGKDFRSPIPRAYAVKRLHEASNEELSLYLLQLVQALKYDPEDTRISGPASISSRAKANPPTAGDGSSGALQPGTSNDNAVPPELAEPAPDTLFEFLAWRASSNAALATQLYWFLRVEAFDTVSSYAAIYQVFSDNYQAYIAQRAPVIWSEIMSGAQFFADLEDLSAELKGMKLDRPKKVDELQRILSSPKWQQLHDLPFPMDPSVRIKSINARSARIFKSALQPLGLTLETSMGDYGIIFKNGDDLRQDQLVLQVIQLMDRLLKQENLDLRLVPYKCLAANSEIGMLQRVNAEAVASVLSNDRSIKKYLQKQHPDPKGPLGISRQAMDNYVRSCAGYCVVTYLLGVGDRHLDNLMITSEGHLIHVDYGFILGRDPKPMPPPMKITKEMVDAMGGPDGEETGVFRQHCYMGYLILRKHANLILNLFALMVDSTIQDIAIERDRAVAKVRERFRLELDDEQAIYDFRNQMVSSESALMPRLIENLHGLAQRMRK